MARSRSSTASPSLRPGPSGGRPIHGASGSGIELSHIWRYVTVFSVAAACALLAAASRIDLVGTSVSLGEAESRLAEAQAANERLQLEVASLTDPAWLGTAATSMALQPDVPVVEVPPVP